jgi:acetyl esterase/lipase
MKLLLALFATLFATCTMGQKTETFLLYGSGQVPNAKTAENREKTTINEWGVEFTTETSVPMLTRFPAKKATGQAVIICPGGGYWGTAGDHEGRQVAKALNKKGITAFVLTYRVPDERTCVDPSLAPLQDAQQAIRTVRQKARTWGIDPHKIGIMGFSAGGHLAASAATHFHFRADDACTDTTSVRPDFVILIYPVISFSDSLTHGGSRKRLIGDQATAEKRVFFSNEYQVNKDCPPAFLVHAQDDDAVPVGNTIAYFAACTHLKVPAEIHIYPKGGHGFGMYNKTTKDQWMERLINWMSY